MMRDLTGIILVHETSYILMKWLRQQLSRQFQRVLHCWVENQPSFTIQCT